MKRPLVIFDLETTGVNPEVDQITQYAFKRINPDGTVDVIKSLVKPSIPISPGAAEVTGISDETVKDALPFKEHLKEICDFILEPGTILAGYNIRGFDVPLLVNEINRAGGNGELLYYFDMIDAFVLYMLHRPRTLSAAFEDLTGKKMSKDAHDAMVDVDATLDVLAGLQEDYDGTEEPEEIVMQKMIRASTPEGAVDFAGKIKLNDEGIPCFTFGKWKDKPVLLNSDTIGYAQWMRRSDFSANTKEALRKILLP